MKKFALFMLIVSLNGCASFFNPYILTKHSSTPDKEVVFLGQENNRFTEYTRTTVTLEPYKEAKPLRLAVAAYPIPEQVYVSCSNFGKSRDGRSITISEYRRSYIRKYDFKPGKFYQFICHQPQDIDTQDYRIEMKEYDKMPGLKSYL